MSHRFESPADTGRHWAEAKADLLRGEIAARDWPETWDRSFDRALALPEEVSPEDGRAYREAAHYAAAARWIELLVDQRHTEAQDEEDADSGRDAERILASVRDALPDALVAERDGTGVFVSDDRGEEVSVTSLAEAWRVVSAYDERYTR